MSGAEKLFNAWTNVSDELIDEAQRPLKRESSRMSQFRGMWKEAGKKCRFVFVRVAVACFLCLILCGTALAASPKLRKAVLQMAEKFMGDHVNVQIEQPEDEAGLTEEPWEIHSVPTVTLGWLPDGGSITIDEILPTIRLIGVEYEDGSRIDVSVQFAEGLSGTFDTEAGEVESILIQSYEATMIDLEGTVTIYWYDSEEDCFVSIIADGFAKEDVRRVAEELIIG